MKKEPKEKKPKKQKEEGSGKGPSKLVVMIAVALALAAVGTAVFVFISKRGEAEAVDADAPADASSASEAAPEGVPAEEPVVDSGPPPEDDSWKLLLVSQASPLSRDFTVELAKTQGGYRIDRRAVEDTQRMLAAASRDGVTLQICSGFRNIKEQTELFDEKVAQYRAAGMSEADAAARAARLVARPGESEHHIGLALDIVVPDYQVLDEGFAQTAASSWLQDHSFEYGYILRYAKEKQDITGIDFEPWHYRYVGAEHAAKIQAGGLCLEEYLEQLEAEPGEPVDIVDTAGADAAADAPADAPDTSQPSE